MTEKRVKLSKKQLQIITECEKQKAEIQQAHAVVSDKLGTVIQLIAEANEVEKAAGLKLDGEFLVFSLEEKKGKKEKKEVKAV